MTIKHIHPALVEKLAEKKIHYENVTEFAKLLPMYSGLILANEYTESHFCKLADRYGKLNCAWGINWYTNTPTNYPHETNTESGFVNVYINTYSLFGDECSSFAGEELGKVMPSITVHFYDNLNSTFYFLPCEADEGLQKLEAWYLETKSKCDVFLKQKLKKELEQKLKELQ